MEDLLATKKLGFGLMRLPRKGIGIRLHPLPAVRKRMSAAPENYGSP